MLIQKQYNKLILQKSYLEIQLQVQQYFSLLKKQKKPLQTFHKKMSKYCEFILC